MLAFGPGLAAWGLVTGVAMTQSGLGVGLSILMSLTVYAGSAQLASLPLLASGAPMWVIWASALCVNLRFVDLQLAVARSPRPPAARPPARARLPARRPQPRRLPEGVARPRQPPAPARRATPPAAPPRSGSVWQVVVARRHPAVVARAAQLGPRLRRHAVDARHRLFAAQRPHRLGRGDRLGGGGGGGVLAAAEAEHPGRDRRRGGRQPGHGARTGRAGRARRHDGVGRSALPGWAYGGDRRSSAWPR